MLWVDMTVSIRETETATAFEKAFEVHRRATASSIDGEIARVRPSVIVFDYDFPTKQGLKTLQEVKRDHGSIPVLMLTVQHSEALAVWAFRARAWDYLVKPMSNRDLDRCLSGLSEMLSIRAAQKDPRKAAMATSLIPEENRVNGARGHAPLTLDPAIKYVESDYRERLSSARAAELCGLTTFQFSRLFKETYRVTFQEYVLRFRIREACRLLKNPNAQVSEVACLVGFNDPSYFGKIFRRYTRVSPSRFAEFNETALDPEKLLAVLNAD
jgi:YesN/AraC family two-component response regulator